MIQVLKKLYLLIYLIASLWLMEIILRLNTVESKLFTLDTVITFLFAIGLALLVFIFCSLFPPRLNLALAAFFLGVTATIFASQIVYHSIFTTFYSVYSALKSPQVLQFWDEIVLALSESALIIAPLYLPLLLLYPAKRYLTSAKLHWPARIVLAILLLIIHGTGLAVVHAGGRNLASAYALYYQRSVPAQSIQRLGLITTMRLDIQRILSDWSPAISPPAAEPTDPANSDPTEYNVLEIDFDSLLAGEENETLANMHRYFASLPGTNKNDYTGKYQDYNLILITAEGFSHLAVREDVTPTLYKLANEGYHFTNFYTPLWGVSTSDGEYVAATGLIPKTGVWSFERSANNSMPLVMGNQLNGLGYRTVAYHNHSYKYYGRDKSHPNMGYEYKGIGNGLNISNTWPRSDLEMMEVSIPEYIDEEPFHAYYMTVSGHLNYSFMGNEMAYKNRKYVQDLPYSEEAQAYLATQIEFDRAMEFLLEQLEIAGVAGRTLIAISADHYPYGLETEAIEELAGHEVPDKFQLYRNSLILWAKGMEPVTIDEPTSSLDIIPTLSNLLGLDYDSRLLMGRDVHSDADPLVIFADGSFITDKGRFDAASGKFTPAQGISVDDGYVERISNIVTRKFYYSAKILDQDYYAKVVPRR